MPTEPGAAANESLWLVVHDRDDPMIVTQTEYSREEASDALQKALRGHLAQGNRVTPLEAGSEIGTRHDVYDDGGWIATIWLSEQPLAGDEGMLTAIVSPSAKQRAHHTNPRRT